MIPRALSLFGFIFCRFCASAVYFAYDAFDQVMYFLISEYLFAGIYEQDICPAAMQLMLELSPAFADASLEQIPFYCSFEKFLGYGDKYAVTLLTVTICEYVAYGTATAMFSFGKKTLYAFLAAQSFCFRKSICGLFCHYQFFAR